MFRELEERGTIFDLMQRRFFLGDADHDFSVRMHGLQASSPLGPAAGPQSQLAQNIVLSWLGGSRVMELKTVQINDELDIPRPCIDMATVGFNVEWSQELKLEQSLEEYVKGAMLVKMLLASGVVKIAPGFEHTLFDMSVGYDLKGIQSERVQTFIRGMQDCSRVIDRLRKQIPDEFTQFRDLDYTCLSKTLTLSTFHGCPPDEIERIIDFLLKENGLHCIVKFNPTLLGKERVHELMHDVMGYHDVITPDSAFQMDTQWNQAVDFVGRLGDTAEALGLGFGAKFSNTLIVENHRSFFPDEKQMYLSGLPLHVLAMNLVGKFRSTFSDRFPISFAAGIDRLNFPDAVALGLVPITVCSDFLKPGGYGRSRAYYDELIRRMDEVGAHTVPDFIEKAYGLGKPGNTDTVLLNTAHYVGVVTDDPRYGLEQNSKLPKKIGSTLELFDCITCDKCVPVCPNDANFTFDLPKASLPIVKVTKSGDAWSFRSEGSLDIEQRHQLANFADFCNECGNCDVFCPEDGGPYILKPRFFGRLTHWREFKDHDGFCLEDDVLHGRFGGNDYRLWSDGEHSAFAGPGFDIRLNPDDPVDMVAGIEGEAGDGTEIDLTFFHILRWIRDSVYAANETNYAAVLARTGLAQE